MRPIAELPESLLQGLRVVFADIDETITTEGQLTAEAFSAIWALHQHGIAVVPVTGRPAGWCDHIARMWPVAGVVGENGAFYFRYDAQRRKLLEQDLLSIEQRQHHRQQLDAIRDRILSEVPGAAIASDQPYRRHDLAIDFCEDVPSLPEPAIDRIVEIFRTSGATAKVSSIHVNGWFGNYDKLGMMLRFAREVLGLDISATSGQEFALYVGDSPNDEPAFAFFRYGVGVANIRDFVHRLQSPPAYVTEHRSGAGFAELTARVLAGRRAVCP